MANIYAHVKYVIALVIEKNQSVLPQRAEMEILVFPKKKIQKTV